MIKLKMIIAVLLSHLCFVMYSALCFALVSTVNVKYILRGTQICAFLITFLPEWLKVSFLFGTSLVLFGTYSHKVL